MTTRIRRAVAAAVLTAASLTGTVALATPASPPTRSGSASAT